MLRRRSSASSTRSASSCSSIAAGTVRRAEWRPGRLEKFHAAGPAEGGILIAAVYESKEACERFVQETLMPLMPIEGGLVGPPQERGAEIINSVGLPG
jgi:hypothetical protein